VSEWGFQPEVYGACCSERVAHAYILIGAGGVRIDIRGDGTIEIMDLWGLGGGLDTIPPTW